MGSLHKIEDYNVYQLHIQNLVLNATGISQTVLIYKDGLFVGATYADTAFENAIEKAKIKINNLKQKPCKTGH